MIQPPLPLAMQKLNHDRSCAASPFFNSLLGTSGAKCSSSKKNDTTHAKRNSASQINLPVEMD
jgi:hypothetical protein